MRLRGLIGDTHRQRLHSVRLKWIGTYQLKVGMPLKPLEPKLRRSPDMLMFLQMMYSQNDVALSINLDILRGKTSSLCFHSPAIHPQSPIKDPMILMWSSVHASVTFRPSPFSNFFHPHFNSGSSRPEYRVRAMYVELNWYGFNFDWSVYCNGTQ